jgi:uncharacterized membrane protein
VSSTLLRIAIGCLVALALASIALPLVGPGATHGIGLAVVKVALIAFVASRVRRVDVYALQWSSMLVLLFIAEGIVRAMTDPSPASWLGGLAVVAGGAYFFAVLAYLRPVKKAAREAAP